MPLKVFAFGSKYFVDNYSKGLVEDCKKFNYDLTIDTVPADSFSAVNFNIQKKMLQAVKNVGSDRILFLDPECRIVKPIPTAWIENDKPVVFYKIQKNMSKNKYIYGAELNTPIVMQPIFLSGKDYDWFEWWWNCSMAVSDIENHQYVPHELFLETAIRFNKIQIEEQYITYYREYSRPHYVVKGSWKTDDTVIQHPALQGVLDPNVKHASDERKKSLILNQRELHNHFQNYEIIKLIDELMFKEKTQGWPKETVVKNNWYCVEDWQFDPLTGLVKHNNFPDIRYHHSISRKLYFKLSTPVTRNYARDTNPE